MRRDLLKALKNRGAVLFQRMTCFSQNVHRFHNCAKLSRWESALQRIIYSLGKSILKPVVLAPIIGIVLSLSDANPPALLATSLSLIGMGAGGIALFLTGPILSSQRFMLNGNVTSGTLLKNLVQPLLAAALVAALAAPPLIAREAIILCAVPSGFFGILFGLRYGIVSLDAGSTLIASSVLSAATIPVAILLTAGNQ
jgi:malonate transporter and related proteins